MAFENIDVCSLKNALTQCKNSIDHSITDELINNISKTSIWQASSQKNLENALIKLSSERYKKLEDKLNDYFDIASYIEEYQALQEENISLENQCFNLTNELYYTENTDVRNMFGKKEDVRFERVKDTNIENQIFNIRQRINNNTEKMENLKNKVSDSI